MGVYIFRSIHGPYIKVGHYSGTNAYSRVAHRGFYSCSCPDEIRDRVSVGDLELLAWFPNLTRREETSVKRRWKGDRLYKSEWYPDSSLDGIRSFLAGLDEDMAGCCDLEAALQTRRRL
jgi:hypothetical protein